jgi:hypothetical protein
VSLRGTFQTTIAGLTPSALNGTWQVRFLSGGRYTVLRNGAVLAQGQDTITASKIVFGHERGPSACKGTQASATYRWALRGRTLTFTPVRETCAGRRIVLLTHPLLRVS